MKMNLRQKFIQAGCEALLIIPTTVIVAFLFNHFYQHGIPIIARERPIAIDSTMSISIETSIIQEPMAIPLAQAYQLFQTRQALFLDARSLEVYEFGHIPGARLFTWNNPETPVEIPETIDKQQLIITYCSDETCDKSIELAYFLFENGFQNVRILYEGWEKWTAANYPIEKGQ